MNKIKANIAVDVQQKEALAVKNVSISLYLEKKFQIAHPNVTGEPWATTAATKVEWTGHFNHYWNVCL